MKRKIEKLNIETSALGMGCWAIGGEWDFLGTPAGWGTTDDAESIKALEAAYDHGIRLFDTAANYGIGHSEELVGKALAKKRRECVITTKFGYNLQKDRNNVGVYGERADDSDVLSHLRKDCENSLRRLGTDYIDVFFLHIGNYDSNLALNLVPVLEKLIEEGKIRSYGWSTDDARRVIPLADQPGFSSVQMNFNIASAAREMITLCEEKQLAAFNRGPLAMGFLTGKYSHESQFPESDVRNAAWVQNGFRKPVLDKLDALKEILVAKGRTPAQGALAWIWAKSERTLPIPGIRTVKQAEENAKAMGFGPLSSEELHQIEIIMGRDV